MIYGLDGYIDVEVGPVQMMLARQFDVEQMTDRSIAEPRELFKRDKTLFCLNQKPKAVR